MLDINKQRNSYGKWLRNIARYFNRDIESSQLTQEHFDFLSEALRIIVSGAKKEQIYLFFQQNLDKIDLQLAQVLKIWADKTFSELELKQKLAKCSSFGNFINSIREFPLGDRASNIEIAIAGYKIILTIFTEIDFPEAWAMTQTYLGVAYCDRIRGNSAENIETGISYFKNTLRIYTKTNLPEDWAETQNNLALAYRRRIVGDKSKNVETAIAHGYNALLVFSETNVSYNWAGTQNNLAIAYRERIEGDKAENLDIAIAYYRNALGIYTESKFPIDWAKIQSNLGDAYRYRIYGDKAENFETAIVHCNNALRIRKKAELPYKWAGTMGNLANTYRDRIKGDKVENVEIAISYLYEILEIYTKEKFPYEWADTQNNLALAYAERQRGNKADNLEKAITHSNNTLKVWKEDNFPLDWVKIQKNLGAFYINRIKGIKGVNLELAIFHLKDALDIYKTSNFVYEWAAIQNSLGVAYLRRLVGNKKKNLETATSYFQNALQIRTKNNFPLKWATTQNNLATVYCQKIIINRGNDISAAVVHFKNALDIYTFETDPLECFRIANNWGSFAFMHGSWQQAHGSWQQAIDAYTIAIRAIERRREWASNDYNRQEIISSAIEVYQNIVQACINLGQIDKAIEYAERGKARNLVDLLFTRDHCPKGNIPQETINKLDNLKQEIIAKEKYLRRKIASDVPDRNMSTKYNRDMEAVKGFQNETLDRTYLNNLHQQLEQLVVNEIQSIDPSFQLTQKVEPIRFPQIKDTLPTKQTALIEWFVSSNILSAFIVTKQQATPVHFDYSKKQFNRLFYLFNQYIDSYSRKDNRWRNNLPNILTRLAQNLQLEAIIEKIKEALPDCNQVILVPHRWLHLLPIHALPIADDKCLLDLFPNGVSYAPSVQLLELTQKQAGKKQEIKQEKNFFAVQNPTQDLQFAEIEVKTIGKRFSPNDEVLAGKEAHRQALTKERLSKANLSHFSCHGSFNFENPELSALHLANSKVEEKTEQDLVATATKTRFLPDRDGSYIDLEQCLTLGEIFGLDLRNCSLVTLSACETGLTDFKSLSDEYIGLPSGFLFAGSPSVVSSLWAVNDLSTTFLMIKFYQNLEEINSVPIALNQAQLWLRSVTKEELYQFANNLSIPKYQIMPYLDADLKELPADTIPFASPYHWAAFCAIGS